jgi:O-antigen ligase
MLLLLWLDRKQSPNVSGALWIPTIWMLHACSKPLGVWFRSSGGNPDAGSPLDRAFLTALIFVALWILIRRRFDWSSVLKENAWLMILISFMLVSVLWSNIPSISFKRWVREFQAILMAGVVLSEPSPRQATESILRRTTFILIPFSLLLIKYFPAYGIQYGRWSGIRMWIGVSQQKNGLASLCIIATFFLIWSLIRRWQGKNAPIWKYQTYVEIIILAITFRLLGGQEGNLFYSATSIYALSAGLLVYWGFYLLRKFGIILGAGTIMTIVAIVIIFGIISLFAGGSTLGSFASSAGRNPTLTGRTEVWAQLLPLAMQQPIFGSGFGGFWTPRTRETFDISGAHSGYLDVLLGLGFVGILLVSLFLLSSCRKAQQELSRDYDWGVLWICYIIMAVVHNFGESSIDTFTSHLTAIILFFSVSSTNFFSRKALF